jgi:hypothetical protein
MNDPHVETLHYQVVTAKDVDYDKVAPLSEDRDEFELRIDGKTALFKMKRHYANADEARLIVENYLKAWYILIGLEVDPDDFYLRFDYADIIDRSPKKIDNNVISLATTISCHFSVSDNVTLHILRARFPLFPINFSVSPDAESMYHRYKMYRQGREPLLSMAYMCLTIFEASAGDDKKREKAATQYNIDPKILSILGKLTTEKGDATEARKVPKNRKFEPLSQIEQEWILAVVKQLIKRAGEYANNPSGHLKQITLKDFPKIN